MGTFSCATFHGLKEAAARWIRARGATAAALVWLTTGCGKVASELGVAQADPGPAGDASVADSGSEAPRAHCHPDAGSAPNVTEEIHYFISYQATGTRIWPCGIYNFLYDGPKTRTDPGTARVLFERAGTVLSTAEYDWRTQVPDLAGPPYGLAFDGFTLLINTAEGATSDLWNLQYNFDGRHVLDVNY